MKTELKENGGIPAHILWTLAIVAGISVANLYYNQPLLNLMRDDLDTTDFRANLIAMVTQGGYALGLLFIVPLGDLFHRKKIILLNFAVLVAALCAMAAARDIYTVWGASLLTGICSVVPQIFVPIASQYSLSGAQGAQCRAGHLRPAHRHPDLKGGERMGRRRAGLAGNVRDSSRRHVSLRTRGAESAARHPAHVQGTIPDADGVALPVGARPSGARVYSVRAGLAFGSFLALWSCLAFKMEGAPFHADSDVVGALGLCGIAGALTASFVGKHVKRVGIRNFNYIGCALILSAWASLYFGGSSYAGIIAGVLLIDIGMQCIQLSNQTSIFELCPSASNRVNTIFMTTYFIGGSLGTFLAGSFWHVGGWAGVAAVGATLTLCSPVAHPLHPQIK